MNFIFGSTDLHKSANKGLVDLSILQSQAQNLILIFEGYFSHPID